MATGLSLLDEDLLSDGQIYKSNSQAMSEDVLPRSRGIDTRTDASVPSYAAPTRPLDTQSQPTQAPAQAQRVSLEELMGGGAPQATQQETQTSSGAQTEKPKSNAVTLDELMGRPANYEQQSTQTASKPESGAFSRGLKEGGIESAKSSAIGGVALIADTVGAKDTANSFFKKYSELQDEKAKEAKPYESFTNVTDGKASFGDFLGYWGGYAIGQVAQSLAAAGVGAAAGSVVPGAGTAAGAISGVLERGAAQEGIKKLVAHKLEGMVAENVAKNAAKGMAAAEAEKLAYNQAARSVFRQLGAAAAVTGQNVMMEGASIYGEARADADKEGKAVDLGRVWTGTILAAATESAMDLVGASSIAKAAGGGNLFKNILRESYKGGLREGSTEAVQSGFERFGAGKDLATAEAIHDYIDSAAAGAVGGVMFGTAKGATQTMRPAKDDGEDKGDTKVSLKETIAKFQEKGSTEEGRDELFASMQENAPVAAALKAAGITSSQDPRFQTVLDDAIRTSMMGTSDEQVLNSAGFIKEPDGQVAAQVQAVADGRKPAAVTGVDEAKGIEAPGLFKHEVTDPEDGKTSVVISKDEGMGQKIQARAQEVGFKQAMGEALGYVEPNATTTPSADDIVVQQHDNQSGHVITEQIVSKEKAGEIPHVDGTTASVKSVEDAAAERQQSEAPAPAAAESVVAEPVSAVDEAAHQAATSPMNEKPLPSEAQKKSGNYAKGHVKLHGIDLTIENPEGSERSGVGADGKPWSQTMAHHYGYVKGTVGNDKDHVDVFIGPNHDSNKVFVVDQKNEDGSFDEHKALLGFNTEEEARAAYHANYEAGWTGMGAISEMPVQAFKSWVNDGKKGKPLAYVAPTQEKEANDVKPAQADSKAAKDESSKGKTSKVAPAKTDKGTESGEQAAPAKAEKVSKEPKPNAKQIKLEAIDSWEDNDDGVTAHIPFNKLPKSIQDDWVNAYAPEDGQKAFSTAEYHDELVHRTLKNQRAERINKKAAENRAGKEEADGIDLKRTPKEDTPARDFAYVKVKSLFDLERAANLQLEREGNGETVELSAVPVGSLVNKLPGLGVIEQSAKLFGKKVKYFKVIGGTNFFDGAVIPGSDTIFINVNAKYPHLNIFGHELVHSIKNAHPKTYAKLRNLLLPMLNEQGMAVFAMKQKADGLTDHEAILEEAIGDIVGDRFGEREFWKMMANENPSLFKQIADIAIKFIDDVIAKLTGKTAGLGSGSLVRDLKATRSEIAMLMKGLGEMVQSESAQATPSATESETETPTFKRTEKEVKPLYSALERAFANPKINLDKNGATTGKEWAAWLNSKRGELGVKKDEVEWVGINEYFNINGKEKLTKEQVLTWVGGNRVHVNDLLLRSYGQAGEFQGAVAEFQEPDEDTMREFIRDRFEEFDDERDMGDFGDGAFDTSPDDMSLVEMKSWISENFGWANFMYQYRRSMENFQRGRINKMTRPKHGDGNLVLKGGKNYAELALFDPTIQSYKAHDEVHFGDVTSGRAIGWLRMNERKDADGNDVLFLEELQSQRGQDGRSKGFSSLTKEEHKELVALQVKEKEEDGLLSDDLARIRELEDKSSGVPNAPFMKDTRSWTSLLIKRAIAYAQERGIDRISWTTGEQQNERYKFPGDELVYKKDGDADTYTLTVKKEGNEVRTVKNVPAAELSAYVGDNTATEIEANNATSGTLKGDDLSVMEANLQPYYNQTVPSVAKEIAGKNAVHVMEIEGTGQQLGFVIPDNLKKMVEEDGLPMFKRSDYVAQFADLPADVQEMAVAKGHTSPPTIKQRLEALRPNMWRRIVQGTFDKFDGIKTLDERAYRMARLANGPQDGAISTILHYGQVFNDNGALNVKKGTKGLLEILKDVGPEVDRYLLWVAANRADNLSKQDKERFFSPDEIKALKKINLGTTKDGKSRAALYIKTLQQMTELNRSVLDVAKSTGLINDEAYKKFAADIWYIPFYRQMNDDKSLGGAQMSSSLVGQELSKKLKGSSRGVNDLMENVLMNWSHILSASMKNQAAVETLGAAEKLGGVVSKLTVVDSTMGKDAQGNAVPLKFAVKVMDKGVETYYRVDDEFLFISLDSIAMMGGSNPFLDVAGAFKTTLTRFVSLSPTFKINNLIRDSIQSVALSGVKGNPLANAFNGIKLYKDDRASALAGGGLFAMGNAFDGDQASIIKRILKTGVRKADVLTTTEQAKAWFGKMQDKYDEVSDSMENANRIALYDKLRREGASHLDAAYAARDLQDFSLQGAWGAIRYASKLLPYFNARLQGLYKMGRDGIDPVRSVLFGNPTDTEKQKAAKFATVLAAVTAVELALYFYQKDDDDWKKREEWDKDSFYWFKLPTTDFAVRIPKPFEIGAIGTLFGRVAEQMADSSADGKLFAQRVAALVHDNFAINPMPQIFRPAYDIARNKDGFTDRSIESMGMERLSKQNRINPNTSPVAVGLAKMNQIVAEGVGKVIGSDGQSMQLSPIQVDYMLRGYLGWMGTVMQSTSTELVQPLKGAARPDRRVDDLFIVGNFVKTMPQSQSKYITAFYKNAADVQMVVSDYNNFKNLGQSEQALKTVMENKDKYALHTLYSQTANQLSAISHRIKLVQDDKVMSGEEKRATIDRMNLLRSDIAKRVEEIRRAREKN